MAALSRLLLTINQKLFHTKGLSGKLLTKNHNHVVENLGSIRCMSEHHVMEITPSRWQWHKTKDWLHFYFFVGVIPVAAFIFYMNVFIGPATLQEIPEGYIPKQWEYYRTPVVRFFSRYFYPDIQMEYEKLLHKTHVANVKRQLFALEKQIQILIREHQDYRYWSYTPSNEQNIIELRKYIDETVK